MKTGSQGTKRKADDVISDDDEIAPVPKRRKIKPALLHPLIDPEDLFVNEQGRTLLLSSPMLAEAMKRLEDDPKQPLFKLDTPTGQCTVMRGERGSTHVIYDKKRKKVGSGQYGRAYLAQEIASGNLGIVKKQRTEDETDLGSDNESDRDDSDGSPAPEECRRQTLTECKTLDSEKRLVDKLEFSGRIYAVQTLCPGQTFLNCFNSERDLSLCKKLEMLYKAALEIQGFHKGGKAHCDLHWGNILWDKEAKVCSLIDFGNAYDCNDKEHEAYQLDSRRRQEKLIEYQLIDVRGLGELIGDFLVSYDFSYKDFVYKDYKEKSKQVDFLEEDDCEETIKIYDAIVDLVHQTGENTKCADKDYDKEVQGESEGVYSLGNVKAQLERLWQQAQRIEETARAAEKARKYSRKPR